MPPPPPRSKQPEADSTLTDNDIMQLLEPHVAGHPDDLSLMQLQYGTFASSSTTTTSGSPLDLHKMDADDPEKEGHVPPHLRPPAEQAE